MSDDKKLTLAVHKTIKFCKEQTLMLLIHGMSRSC